MAFFKCKMCGGSLEIAPDATVIECDYCGTSQTLPRLTDEKRAQLYDRANQFRRSNEFDKAMGIYEQILNEDNTDAEAYWSLVLCKYGIEYVEDPTSHRRVPTVNRAQFTSIYDDVNYQSALKYCDSLQRGIYEKEAAAINEIQKGILAISQREEPFDVFICYKETGADGDRTTDSVLAQDVYYQLTREGLKVFFARITLEDKLGSAYEPYIFAALNSAKVMLVIGTRPEHFEAVWVKNEWSRYLSLVKESHGDRVLIPAYRDMDPYNLPKEFSHLQAQNMAKIGFMQDLVRGILKVVKKDEPKVTVVKETVVGGSATSSKESFLKRAFIFLEDGNWASANEYAEKVLDIDPECAEAYLAKLMCDLKVRQRAQLSDCKDSFALNANFKKALKYGDDSLNEELNNYLGEIGDRRFKARKDAAYNKAVSAKNNAKTESAFHSAAALFKDLNGYNDSEEQVKICEKRAEECRINGVYNQALSEMNKNTSASVRQAVNTFATISGFKDADEKRAACERLIPELLEKEEAERERLKRLEDERRARLEKQAETERRIRAEQAEQERQLQLQREAEAEHLKNRNNRSTDLLGQLKKTWLITLGIGTVLNIALALTGSDVVIDVIINIIITAVLSIASLLLGLGAIRINCRMEKTKGAIGGIAKFVAIAQIVIGVLFGIVMAASGSVQTLASFVSIAALGVVVTIFIGKSKKI